MSDDKLMRMDSAEWKPIKPQWISVDDRLPEDGRPVLLFIEIYGQDPEQDHALGIWLEGCWVLCHGAEIDGDWEPTHWMPLTDPPEEK
jgi:hypothetical protein